jgi:DnaJ-domain-containing protein 1
VEDPVIDEKEEEPVSAASVESQLEIDISRDEPTVYARTDTMNDAPKAPTLPLDDPFAAGNDVESLISPLKINTLYDILRCEPSATRAELKKSYILLAKETHPDALLQNGIVNDEAAEQRFVEIAHAWKILGDSTSRRRYDRELKGKGLAKSAGNIFENWVMGAAKAMDEALTKAENELEVNGKD